MGLPHPVDGAKNSDVPLATAAAAKRAAHAAAAAAAVGTTKLPAETGWRPYS